VGVVTIVLETFSRSKYAMMEMEMAPERVEPRCPSIAGAIGTFFLAKPLMLHNRHLS
jgi:hypothetical protein